MQVCLFKPETPEPGKVSDSQPIPAYESVISADEHGFVPRKNVRFMMDSGLKVSGLTRHSCIMLSRNYLQDSCSRSSERSQML